jgi:hypothetical protein
LPFEFNRIVSPFKPPFHKEQTMKIFFLNNDGGGFADQIDVAEGTTLGQLFQQRMPGCDPHNYLIRVNRQPAVAEEPLAEGCRVSVTPTKIQGAATLA